MKKILLFLSLVTIAISSYSQKITEKDMSKFKQEWKAYADSCSKDSTLYVYWEYTGKEKKTESVDTTGGRQTKIVTILPTRKMNWMKESPNMDGFEKC